MILARKSWDEDSVILSGFITGYGSTRASGTPDSRRNLGPEVECCLRTATFSNETASGWQEALFRNLSPSREHNLRDLLLAPTANYAYTPRISRRLFTSYPLRALANGEDGGTVCTSTRQWGSRTQSYNSNNYWVMRLNTNVSGHRRTDCCLLSQLRHDSSRSEQHDLCHIQRTSPARRSPSSSRTPRTIHRRRHPLR